MGCKSQFEFVSAVKLEVQEGHNHWDGGNFTAPQANHHLVHMNIKVLYRPGTK